MSEVSGNINDIKGELTQIKEFKHSSNKYPLIKLTDRKGRVIDFNISEGKKNLITLGTTGSGKTTSVLLPTINNLIKHHNVGLILDVKSELYQDVYHIAKSHGREKDIVFVGTQDFCTPINILASIKNEEQLKNILTACSPSVGSNDSYWAQNAVEDVMNVVALDKWYHEYKGKKYAYNFNTLLDYIINQTAVLSLYYKIEEVKDYLPTNIEDIVTKTKADAFSLYSAAINPESTDAQQQKTWRSGRLATTIRPFTEEPFYSNLNCSDNQKTLHDMVFKEGKIIVLTIPIEYESVGFTLGKLIREIYYKSVLSNSPEDRIQLKLGDEFNRYTFLLIDEYQGFVNTESSNGVITDDSWGSISRSFENINIYATQSIRHLDNAIGDVATDVIMSNCASEIILRAQDARTLEHIRRVYDRSLKGDLEFLINPDGRYCAARLECDGGKICFRGTMDVPEQAYFHSSEYKEGKKISAISLNEINRLEPRYANGLFISRNLRSGSEITLTNGEKIRGISSFWKKFDPDHTELSYAFLDLVNLNERVSKLMIFTPYNFDFNKSSSGQLVERLNRLSRLKSSIREKNYIRTITDEGYEYVLKSNLAPKSINISDEIMFVCKDTYKGWEDISAKLNIPPSKRITIQELRSKKFKVSEKILCFVMGGGDLSSNQFDYFRSIDNFVKVKKANQSGLIYTGIAHATDAFVFDYLADRSFITPTELAEHLIKLGYPRNN